MTSHPRYVVFHVQSGERVSSRVCLFVDLSNLKAHCVTFNVIYGYEMEQLLYKCVFVFHSLVMSFDIYLNEQVHLQSRACVCSQVRQ